MKSNSKNGSDSQNGNQVLALTDKGDQAIALSEKDAKKHKKKKHKQKKNRPENYQNHDLEQHDNSLQEAIDTKAQFPILQVENLPSQSNHVANGTEPDQSTTNGKLSNKFYEKELARLQTELVKLQYWVKHEGLRVAIIFEGRDAAGKGGSIQRIVESLNPRGCRVVALGKPSDVERTQWYFQRYVEHLPAAGEIILFDRSWYNRAGVERVMGFCSDAEYQEFMQSCPEFERMLVRSGIILLKYWFSVNPEEQERRLQARLRDPAKRWKLSSIDLESRNLWDAYSQAKDEMFAHTNIPEAPWFTVEADDKKRARLNLMHHILSKIPYQDITPHKLELPPRQPAKHIARPPVNEQFFVPQVY